MEFHEVDLGRKWVMPDVNYNFQRNFANISTDINALLRVNGQESSVGLSLEYQNYNDMLDVKTYFSDIVPSELIGSFVDDGVNDGLYKINLPVSASIDAAIDFKEIAKHRDNVVAGLDSAVKKVRFQIEGGQGNIMFNSDEKMRYDISSFVLNGGIDGGIDKITIKDADFDLSGLKTKLGFDISGFKKYFIENSLKNLKMSVTAEIKELKIDDLNKYWPRYIVESAWNWCKTSLFAGTMHNAAFKFDFAYDPKLKNIAFAGLDGKVDVSDAEVNYLAEMPNIYHVYGQARFTADSIKVNLDKGVSEGVILTGGYVNLYDLDKYNNYADIDLKLSSSVTDALRLIDNPPLGYTSEMGLKPDTLQGQAETELGLKFEIKNDLTPEEVEVKVKSDLTEVRVPDAFKNKTVTADELKLEVDNQGLALSGDAKLENIPLKLSWNERFADKNYRSRYKLSAKFNNALKKELDFDSSLLNPPYVDGYALVDAEITVYNDRKTVVNLNAQIDKMAVDFAFLGFKKPVNERGNLLATLNIYDNKLVSLPKFSLFKDDFKIEGKIDLTADGNIKTVDITNISGPRTAAKARIDIAHAPKKKVKINISGTSYDLTPFFDRDENKIKVDRATLIKTPEDEDDELEDVTDTDIFIAVNNLWTNPHVPVTNFAGSAKLLNGIGVNEIHMVGNYNNNKKSVLKFDYVPRPNKEFLLSVDSNDAGATLKVLRVYNNMKGGNIQVEARRNAQKEFIGHAKIRDFSIYNTPVIAKLLTVASFSGMVDLLMGEGLTFSHFDAPFEYRNRQLSLKEAKAFGDVVGITAQGTYDRRFDEVNFHGVIAPAYSLNTMLGKIPLVGNLLVGKDGTVFAANYSATGSVEDAEIDINPLSALSPSSLKDKFNALFGGDGN